MALVNGSERSDAVEDSDEAIENAAAAHGMANQETMDYQVTRNPDYYAVKRLLAASGPDHTIPDTTAIEAIASNYF